MYVLCDNILFYCLHDILKYFCCSLTKTGPISPLQGDQGPERESALSKATQLGKGRNRTLAQAILLAQGLPERVPDASYHCQIMIATQ